LDDKIWKFGIQIWILEALKMDRRGEERVGEVKNVG